MIDSISIVYHHLEALLHSRIRRATNSIQIYCPYARSTTLEKLISVIPDNVSTVLTMRWSPREFAQGSSDPGVYSLCSANEIDLRKHPSLHLKMYVIDESDVLVGSANLTERALTESTHSNVECMVSGLRVSEADRIAMAEIDRVSTVVSADDYEMAVNAFDPKQVESAPNSRSKLTRDISISQVPAAETPLELWTAYRESSRGNIDLEVFRIPPGLSEPEFLDVVRSEFFLLPILESLTEKLRQTDVYFGELKRWLKQTCSDAETCSAEELTVLASTLLNWIEGLGSPSYKVERPNYSEKLQYETKVPLEPLITAPGLRKQA